MPFVSLVSLVYPKSEPHAQATLQLAHRIGLVRQTELRAADYRIHRGERRAIQDVDRINPPIEGQPIAP